jgi:hypothetical protein
MLLSSADVAVAAVDLPPHVVAESTAAAPDTDRATEQTVERMASYIRDSIRDPLVRGCAEYAWRRFGMGLASPAMKAWAVFWWVKHSVKFRLDEATMFRVGLKDEQDLLIGPSVLVRMKDPAEDCDGFTMLGAAMLRVLGVPVYIATVAADPRDRTRWSHVFLVAVLPTGVLPLDLSHGVGPGWMVPRGQVFRWQAWDLDGARVDLAPSRFQGLHGYVRMGVGQLEIDPVTGEPIDYTSGEPGGWTGTGGQQVWGAPAPGGNWTQFFQNLATQGASIAGKIFTPPAYQQIVRDPVTGQLVSTTVRNSATPYTGFAVGAGSLTPWVVGGGLLLLTVVLLSQSRR